MQLPPHRALGDPLVSHERRAALMQPEGPGFRQRGFPIGAALQPGENQFAPRVNR
jgi:hypothetical protein